MNRFLQKNIYAYLNKWTKFIIQLSSLTFEDLECNKKTNQ